MQIITLTTDFGTNDWFVGSMKGVILGINPLAHVVDITHGIPAGDTRDGAFVLSEAYKCFPRGTVHVVVVDPGVGSPRPSILVETQDYFFIGPDNGVLSLALCRERIIEIRRVENEAYFRHPVSRTFHGRDVFTPVAAHLTRGIPMAEFGPSAQDYVRLDWPEPTVSGEIVHGEIVHIDRFGNGITNVSAQVLTEGETAPSTVTVRGVVTCPVKTFYREVSEGQPLALAGSSGLVEIAVNNGNAAHVLGLKLGDSVVCLCQPVTSGRRDRAR
jgi:S-adenosylmethionine hydrolase